ncbi:abortive infection system toxin AbiGii family protein [Bacillus cereus]|uniref:abortive infection system toxin AbiGii family protein n=1 Tax=Bacillus cereus TaxID=1396 RepID=UPI000BF5590A|nr:abortive infection system toxin AbiGii family protein [Bacillus cereus]PER99156.1 abortive phage resistance protein [Bacillus cereus]
MFANFKKAFKKDESDTKIPKAILDAMSDSLPSGLKYTQMDKGYCAIIPEKGELKFKFENLKIKIPKNIKLTTAEELTEFLYRTQQVVETETDVVTINNHKIKLSDFVKHPFKEKTFEKGSKFSIQPESFGEPFPLKVEHENGQIAKEFLIERKPLADMHKSLFKSINEDVLEITYTLDEQHHNLKFNVNVDLQKAKTVLEIIEAFNIYIAFIEGKIKIEGMLLNPVPIEKERVAAGTALDYWKTVQAVAEKLDVQFKPDEGEGAVNAEWIAKLYRSFVEKKAYKQRSGTASFITGSKGDWDEKKLLEKDAMALQYTLNEEIKVYGVDIPLYSAVALLNCKVESVIPVEGLDRKYEFKVIPADEKGIYQAARHFSTKEDFDEVFKNMGEVLEELSRAEEI